MSFHLRAFHLRFFIIFRIILLLCTNVILETRDSRSYFTSSRYCCIFARCVCPVHDLGYAYPSVQSLPIDIKCGGRIFRVVEYVADQRGVHYMLFICTIVHNFFNGVYSFLPCLFRQKYFILWWAAKVANLIFNIVEHMSAKLHFLAMNLQIWLNSKLISNCVEFFILNSLDWHYKRVYLHRCHSENLEVFKPFHCLNRDASIKNAL